jgi:thiamine biosynthesis protein ThiS
MTVIANGLEVEVQEGTTVEQLLCLLGEPKRPDMIVEINRKFIHLQTYATTVIQAQDRVEVIHLDIGG